MKMKSKYLIFVSIVLILLSCNDKKTVYQDKIEFPSDVTAFMSGDCVYEESVSPEMKIVIYADSSGCTGCKLELDMWKFYMESISQKYNDRVLFKYYLQPRDKDELLFILENEEFNYPVYIDMGNQFGKLNSLHTDEVFLLDKDNHILLAGNPLATTKRKKEYEEVIQKYLNEKKS